jgi:hypothetical protein
MSLHLMLQQISLAAGKVHTFEAGKEGRRHPIMRHQRGQQ